MGALALAFSATTAVVATQGTGHKVTICHATSSETNPYVIITVDIASAGYGDKAGHADHGRDGVWYPGAKSDKFDWGDIIPPYDYTVPDPDFHYDGLNWTAAGQAILRAGCTTPEEPEHKPDIKVVKSASDTNLPAGGGEVTYTYKVTATGNVPLSDVSVSDNKCSPVTYVSGDTNGDDFLDLSEEWTFHCTTTITETTTNTAVATGYDDETKVTDDDQATVTVAPPPTTPGNRPSIEIHKTADPTSLPAGGGSVTYTYAVWNDGDVPLSNVTVGDDKCDPATYASGDTNSDDKLDLTESWTFTCTMNLTETTTNTAVATGHYGQETVTDTEQATVTVAPPPTQGTTPSIAVDKTAEPTTLPAGGGSVTYTYIVTNDGDVPLSSVSVSDDKCDPVGYVSGDTNANDKLDLSESWTFTCTTTITETTTNTATATGHHDQDTVTDTDQATVMVPPPPTTGNTPNIEVSKSADPTTLPAGGGSVTYTYLVWNDGSVPLSNVTVDDDKCAPVAYGSGDTNANDKLDLTESWTFTCTMTITETTTNTAVATGWDNDTKVTDTEQATVTVSPPATEGPNPAIGIVKTPSVTNLPIGGGPVTYTYLVTNTGDVPLSSVTVADDKCATVAYVSGDTNSNDDLDLTETWTFSCTMTITVTTTNTAVATGHAGEEAVSGQDQATVTVAPLEQGVEGETNVPTAPATDVAGDTSSPGGSLPILLIVLGIIGLAAVVLTPARVRR